MLRGKERAARTYQPPEGEKAVTRRERTLDHSAQQAPQRKLSQSRDVFFSFFFFFTPLQSPRGRLGCAIGRLGHMTGGGDLNRSVGWSCSPTRERPGTAAARISQTGRKSGSETSRLPGRLYLRG